LEQSFCGEGICCGEGVYLWLGDLSVLREFICGEGIYLWLGDLSVVKGFICGEGIYLWRGDLSPLGREAPLNRLMGSA
jgi:hypothetical protein